MNKNIQININELIAKGVITVNEARQLLGFDPLNQEQNLEVSLKELNNRLPKITMEEFIAKELVKKVFNYK